MLDIYSMVDTTKLTLYLNWLYSNHIYAEGDSSFHKSLTTQVVEQVVDKLNLNKSDRIIDLGCGPGYFLDEMLSRGYTNSVGVTLSIEDVKMCQDKGHTVHQHDISFLPQSNGYTSQSTDFIFCRHALEHSPFPVITLMECNRVLKLNSKIYIELPCPDSERQHEFNDNHYSILGIKMLCALLQRTGFEVVENFNVEFDLVYDKDKTYVEKYYGILAQKKHELDIKYQ